MADTAVQAKDQTPSIQGAPKAPDALETRLAAISPPQGLMAAARAGSGLPS